MFVVDAIRARLLLILCCIICYAGSLHNDYALDDDFALYNNVYVQQGIKGIPDILSHPYYQDLNLSFDYRPVAGITFAIERELFGNNPHISHAVNIVLYIIAVLLLFQVLIAVFELDVLPAFIIALIFSMHPSHVEVVASIKNREEILSLIFALLAFLYSYRLFEMKNPSARAICIFLALLFLLLSFVSKLTNITIVPILFLWLFYKGRHRQSALFITLMALAGLLTIVYVGKLYSVQHRPIYDLENPLVLYTDLSSKLGMGAASLFFYARFMCVPYPFSFFYGYDTIPVISITSPLAVVSAILHIGLLICGFFLFFRKKVTGFFILAYLIAISVYSNLILLYTGIVSERALFSPGIWFIAASVCFIYTIVAGRQLFMQQVGILLVSLILIIYGVLDINRVAQWHDTISLMSGDVRHLDMATLPNYFYASVLKETAEAQRDTAIQNKYLSESKKYFYKAATISPAYPYSYFRLGLIYRYDCYIPDSAFYFLKKAYSLNSSLTDVAYQYGRAEYEYGDVKIASGVFEKLYHQIPEDTFTVFYHALLLLKTGYLSEGHQVNASMLRMAPGYYQSYFNEGLYYQLTDDADNAAKNYERAIQLGCTDQTVYAFLADYYEFKGRKADADRIAKLIR